MMMRGFRKTRTYERYYPQGFGIVAAASVFWLEICFPLQNGLLLSAGVAFGAILFGFTGTAFAVFNISTDFMEKSGAPIRKSFLTCEGISAMRCWPRCCFV